MAELNKSVKNLKRKKETEKEAATEPPKKNCKTNDIEILEEILNESNVEIKQEIADDDSLENFKNDLKKINGSANHEIDEVEIKSEDESEINLGNEEEADNSKKKKNKNKKKSSSIEDLLSRNEIKSEESDSEKVSLINKANKFEINFFLIFQDDDEAESNREKIDLSSSSEDESEEEDSKSPKEVTISKVGFSWDVLKNPNLLSGAVAKDEESSDDEDENEDESKKKQQKNKKMTESEKRELAKREEERLRRIEAELMDSKREPQSVDEFDRAVLANPNSSALWLKYMAYHLQVIKIAIN